jgi:hypothetical protein
MNGVVSRLHANVGFGEAGETSRTTGLGANWPEGDREHSGREHKNLPSGHLLAPAVHHRELPFCSRACAAAKQMKVPALLSTESRP